MEEGQGNPVEGRDVEVGRAGGGVNAEHRAAQGIIPDGEPLPDE